MGDNELVCEYCGKPEEYCVAAQTNKSIRLVSVEEYQRIKDSGDYE